MTIDNLMKILAQRDPSDEVRLEIRERGTAIRAWDLDGATYEAGRVILWGRLSERRCVDAD